MRGIRSIGGAACATVALATLALAAPSPAQRWAPRPAASAAKARRTASFATPSFLGVRCSVADQPGRPAGVDCQSIRRRPLYRQKATLGAGGRAAFCRERGSDDHCRIGRRSRAQGAVLGVGRGVTVGRFRCQVQRKGVRCTVRSSGRGFLINRSRVTAIGGGGDGAGKGPLLHLAEFMSPDHKVWCATEASTEEVEGETFCGTGFTVSRAGALQVVYPQSLAELSPKGLVTICAIAAPPPAGTPGPRAVCLQNWNAKARVLEYGQQSEANGVLCTSARNGITCTESAGAGRGKGFRVSAGEAVRVR